MRDARCGAQKVIHMAGNTETGPTEATVVDQVLAALLERVRARDGIDRDLIASIETAWKQGKLKDVSTLRSLLASARPCVCRPGQ